jgi:hypothetical protein
VARTSLVESWGAGEAAYVGEGAPNAVRAPTQRVEPGGYR